LRLLVFLGNPGSVYAKNRHNAGRLLTNSFHFSPYWRVNFKGLFSSLPFSALLPLDKTMFVAEPSPPYGDAVFSEKSPAPPGGNVNLLQPETFMNLSGESVRAAAAFYKIPPEQILVVHDELELALGQASFKFGGGLGGHNGLRSIKAHLGTADFWRLRIGIGRPSGEKAAMDISSWVLSDFSADEVPVLDKVLAECAAAVERTLISGTASLLPEWSKKKIA
jgi:PTH1 family peptidyl-tRNA hydrolase